MRRRRSGRALDVHVVQTEARPKSLKTLVAAIAEFADVSNQGLAGARSHSSVSSGFVFVSSRFVSVLLAFASLRRDQRVALPAAPSRASERLLHLLETISFCSILTLKPIALTDSRPGKVSGPFSCLTRSRRQRRQGR
jgi:hypothetical protein